MISFSQGDLFKSGAEALVNPCNTVGIMGAGLAKQFKNRYPGNYVRYLSECKADRMSPGRIFVSQEAGVWIVNFPTKQHWRDPSKYRWIREGLADLRGWLIANHIKSVAIPALGCGLGQLEWSQVKMMIESALAGIPDCNITVFEPKP